MDSLEQLLKAIADKNRLRIMAFLSCKKLCVCELAELLDITQPSVSKHLKKLKDANLIESEQDGLWTNYFLNEDTLKNEKILKQLLNELLGLKEIQQQIKQIQSLNREKLCCKS